MKVYLILILLLCAFMLLFPLAVTGSTTEPQTVTAVVQQTAEESTQTETENETQPPEEESIKVLRTASGKVIDLELYDYIVGCVASEMPAYFEKEALKAQAVACYTYAKWIKQNSDSGKLSGADISDSPSTHQGYLDESELKEKWGDKYDSYIQRIMESVNEVLGEYLTYNNEPIIACYHALSSGKTESAETVWGEDIPYLQSVDADGDILSPDYDQTVTFTQDEFKKIAAEIDGVKLSDDASKWIKISKKSDTGYAQTVSLGGKALSGEEIRTAFSLPSANFTVQYADSKFTFSVKGCGHQLGMSQYSADYMARQGKTYKEILLHFYTGVSLQSSEISG